MIISKTSRMCQILLQAVAHINKGNSQKFNEDDRSVN